MEYHYGVTSIHAATFDYVEYERFYQNGIFDQKETSVIKQLCGL